jgi:hypothetical protein
MKSLTPSISCRGAATISWALDVNKMSLCDARITVLDIFPYFKIPYFKNIRRDPVWGEETIRRKINSIDEKKLLSIVHVRL